MALTILLMCLAFFCVAVTGQDSERKNIKMLFVPAEVMKALRKNLTTKDLPPGLPGQGTQRWTPVRLPGDRTHTFEIRINPRTAHKLNMNFQHFRIGRGHGLLLELKNVSLSSKGKTVLDRLVEFYKNCGGARNHRIGMHMIHHPLPMMHRRHPHSLLLPGDIPLLQRIQTALERFFPKRHDGSVDVFQHKDSSGAVHFLPFEEVRREVNNLIKRTLVKRDCVKISTNALTRALSEFRRQYDNDTSTPSFDEEEDVNDEGDSEGNRADSDGEGEEKDQVLSFSRNLDSLNPHPVNKVNLTSSSAINVPSDAQATRIVSALADLRKELNDLSSGFRKKVSQSMPSNLKETDSTSSARIGVSTDDNTGGSNGNIDKKISSDDKETNDEKNSNLANFDISEVKNRRKKMSSDDGDEQNISGNNNKNDNNNNNNSNNMNNNNNKNNSSSHNDDKVISVALKLKNIEDDLKTDLRKVSLKLYKNISKLTRDATSVKNSRKNDNRTVEKVSNARPVNQTVNHLQRVKTIKEVKVSTNVPAHDEQKKIKKHARIKGRKDKAKHRNKHKGRIRDKKIKKRPSLVFHYKPKSLRLKLHYKGGEYLKAGDDEEVEDVQRHKDKGRFVQFIHIRRPRPKIKEMLLPDEDESNGYRQRNFDDSPVEAVNDEDSMKVQLLRKLRWLRIHGHAPKVRRRKSPKLRVVVYDDEDEDKEPHHERWHNNDTDEYTEKIHEADSETDSEPESESESEPEADTSHRSASLFMDDENTEHYNQGETSNSESDVQYLSDSIGDDSSHFGRSDSGADVPDLEPYLKKHYEDEEDEENEEIKMYNEQDGIDARKLGGDSMEKRISKKPKEDDTILDEKTNKIDESNNEEPGKIHIHKIPFKIQEDSDGVDTSYLKEPQHDSLGLQQVLGPGPDITSMASQPVPITSNPTITTYNQNALDMSPNMVMPPEQSMMIPAAGELPQTNGATTPVARPNPAAFTGMSFQPSVTTQMNNMMPQTPFPQVSSMMPMQAAAPEAAPMTPIMQPGQMRAVISRGEKPAVKRPGSNQHLTHTSKISVVDKKRRKFRNKSLDKLRSGHSKAPKQK